MSDAQEGTCVHREAQLNRGGGGGSSGTHLRLEGSAWVVNWALQNLKVGTPTMLTTLP